MKALNGWEPLSPVVAFSEGMMYCPLDVLAWRIASATESTWLGLMHPGQPSAVFTRLARSVASRLESVRPGRVGTPLNEPLRASLIRCPWYEPKKNILSFLIGPPTVPPNTLRWRGGAPEKNGF